MDDPGQRGVGAHTGRFDLQESTVGDGAGVDRVTEGLLRRDGLARDGGLVHGAGACDDDTVDGDLGAVLHEHRLAHDHLSRGDRDLLAMPQHDGDLRRDRDQLGQGGAGLVERGVLQGVTDREQKGHSRRFPELTDEQCPDCGDRDEQVDADDPRNQTVDRGPQDGGSSDDRSGDHEHVTPQLRARQAGGRERDDDRQAGDQRDRPEVPNQVPDMGEMRHGDVSVS